MKTPVRPTPALRIRRSRVKESQLCRFLPLAVSSGWGGSHGYSDGDLGLQKRLANHIYDEGIAKKACVLRFYFKCLLLIRA